MTRKTKFDTNIIPQTQFLSPKFPAGNARQIVRNSRGVWFVAFESKQKGVMLTINSQTEAKGKDFNEPLLIAGPGEDSLFPAVGTPAGISLFIDRQDHLYVVWYDGRGIWFALCDVSGPDAEERIRKREAWQTTNRQASAPELIVEDAVLGDVLVDNKQRVHICYTKGEAVYVITYNNHTWHKEQIARRGIEPVMDIDHNNDIHIAYTMSRELTGGKQDSQVWYARSVNGSWKKPELAAYGISFHPSIVITNGLPLIVYQVEGLKKVSPQEKDYLRLREGGGASIGYIYYDGIRWQRGYVAKAQEILIRDQSEIDVFQGRLYPLVEEMWRPVLSIDKHGVAWVFYSNTTRRHTYFARWLGKCFSDSYECRGAYYVLSPDISVEKYMPKNGLHMGVLNVAAGRLYFSQVPVPSLSSNEERHVLFLDLLEVSEMIGLEQVLNKFEKYSHNPVSEPGKPGRWDDQAVSFPNVRFDRGKFTMEYEACGTGNEGWVRGYAESSDGIDWERPNLGLIEVNESKNNNCIHRVTNFIDKEESDPDKRYKGVWIEGDWKANPRRLLAYSADGIHWRWSKETKNMDCLLEGGGPSFKDPLDISQRRFKAVGRTVSAAGRALGMIYSADLRRWHGEVTLLDPESPYRRPAKLWRGHCVAQTILDPCGEKHGDQIYWGTVWIENGVYLCLYGAYDFDGRYEAALAMSRDGLNYMRIKNGESILPCGGAGEWDSGMIAIGFGVAKPLVIGDRIRIYYGGSPWHHGTDPYRPPFCIGFAELRREGWTYLRTKSNVDFGYITTIPINLTNMKNKTLIVNVEGLSSREAENSLAVEVLDAYTNRPISGFSKEDCQSISSGVKSAVSWRGGKELSQLEEQCIKLRFYLSGAKVRLYSYWFGPKNER